MNLSLFPDKVALGEAAAAEAADRVRRALASQGPARIIAATSAAQFEFLEALTISTFDLHLRSAPSILTLTPQRG